MPAESLDELEARIQAAINHAAREPHPGEHQAPIVDITDLWRAVGKDGLQVTAQELGLPTQELIAYLQAVALGEVGGRLEEDSDPRRGLRRLAAGAVKFFKFLRENWLEVVIVLYVGALVIGYWVNFVSGR